MVPIQIVMTLYPDPMPARPGSYAWGRRPSAEGCCAYAVRFSLPGVSTFLASRKHSRLKVFPSCEVLTRVDIHNTNKNLIAKSTNISVKTHDAFIIRLGLFATVKLHIMNYSFPLALFCNQVPPPSIPTLVRGYLVVVFL